MKGSRRKLFWRLNRLASMPSTAIADIEYDPDRKLLRITFVTGRIYLYEDVPIDEFEGLMSAGSRGAHFNKNIRGRYEYREVR